MKKINILFLIFISLKVSSQDWNLININYKYNYSVNKENFISTTIWVDSTRYDGFWMNQIMQKLNPTDSDIYSFPQFLGYNIVISIPYYQFYGINFQFYINSKAELNDKWVFDEQKNIQAKVVGKSAAKKFNILDSIKTIALSNKDTIIISKNFGIIRFDSIYDKNVYNLVGINNIYGDSVPDFFDFFNFSTGNIFEYHGTQWRYDSGPAKFYIEKDSILSKEINDDTIKYNMSTIDYEINEIHLPNCDYNPKCATSRTGYDTWIFVYSKTHPTNQFNNQLYLVTNNSDIQGYHDCNGQYTIVHCLKDSNNIYTKELGLFQPYEFYLKSNSVSYLFISDNKNQNYYCDNYYEFHYKDGLGLVYYDNRGFEWGSTRELAGYVKGKDTVGVITDNNKLKLIADVNNLILDNIEIYPNPTKDLIWIKNIDNQKIMKITISDLNGGILYSGVKTKSISLEKFRPGLYIIEIRLEKTTIWKKITKIPS